jgi:tRNA(Ile)-lysidine synthase
MAAREIRYNWFDKLMIQNNINYLITGHHLNDQLETFMINLGRGTGIEGLVGISENSKILRPLLNYTKKEIILYAKKKSYKWNLDQTNLKNDYLRNSLRNKVVTEWIKIIPDLEKNFYKTISQLGYAEKALKTQVDYFKRNYFVLNNSEFQINIKKLLSLSPQEFYFNSLFKEFGFVKSSELIKLINSSPGKLLRSDSHEILKDREYLFLRKIKEKQNKSYEINLIPQKLNDPFEIEISLKPFKNKRNSIEVDPSLLSPILEIKKPYTGAYFYPSGMSGKKKLSKYFKDEKLSLFEKQNQWILTSNNQVVWVIGKRADNRFISSLKSNKRMYISIELS